MNDNTKVTPAHLRRSAIVYVRQSSPAQVEHNRESSARQYALTQRALALGWPAERICVIDDDHVAAQARRRGTRARRVAYDSPMTVALGRVKDGKVVLEGAALPEGAVVTVLADDDRPAVKLSPELEAELLAAIDEADAEEGGAGPEFLASLKRPG
jgi:hypothetical protein